MEHNKKLILNSKNKVLTIKKIQKDSKCMNITYYDFFRIIYYYFEFIYMDVFNRGMMIRLPFSLGSFSINRRDTKIVLNDDFMIDKDKSYFVPLAGSRDSDGNMKAMSGINKKLKFTWGKGKVKNIQFYQFKLSLKHRQQLLRLMIDDSTDLNKYNERLLKKHKRETRDSGIYDEYTGGISD